MGRWIAGCHPTHCAVLRDSSLSVYHRLYICKYQEGVRSTGILRAVLAAVMRRVNRSSTRELDAKQRACASLIERKVLESGLI